MPASVVNSWLSADLAGTKKLGRRDESISSVEGTLTRGRRDRDLESVQTLSERRNLHAYVERKAELAVRGENLAQQRLFEAEADVEVKIWEKRNSAC